MKNYYYAGKYFDNLKEMLAYSLNFSETQITSHSVDYLFDFLKKECIMNLEIYEISATNKEIEELINSFRKQFCEWFEKKLHEYFEKNPNEIDVKNHLK